MGLLPGSFNRTLIDSSNVMCQEDKKLDKKAIFTM